MRFFVLDTWLHLPGSLTCLGNMTLTLIIAPKKTNGGESLKEDYVKLNKGVVKKAPTVGSNFCVGETDALYYVTWPPLLTR